MSSDNCAADLKTCQRMSASGLKALCNAKGIRGYTKMTPAELSKDCCEKGGLLMPENFRTSIRTLKKSVTSGKTPEEIAKIAFKNLLKDSTSIGGFGSSKATIGAKRRSCFAGSFPKLYSSQLRDEFEKRGVYNMAEDGDLDLSCAKKCLSQDSNWTCAAYIGKQSWSDDDGKKFDVLFFGNYPTGLAAIEKTFSKCKNNLPLFWKVSEKMGALGEKSYGKNDCRRGSFDCARTMTGSHDYDDKRLKTNLRYSCNDNAIRLTFGHESEKYDDRAFGGSHREYDEWNRHKLQKHEDEIVDDMSIDVPLSEVQSLFIENAKVKKIEPSLSEGDKSFSVDTDFTISYPALKTQADADALAASIKKVKKELGHYGEKSKSRSRSFW